MNTVISCRACAAGTLCKNASVPFSARPSNNGLTALWLAARRSLCLAIQPVDVVLYIAIGKPGIKVHTLGVNIPVTRQYIPFKPGSAVLALGGKIVSWMLYEPGLNLSVSDRSEVALRLTDIPQQQVKTSQQWHRIQLRWWKLLQALPRLLQEFRLPA